MHQISHFFIAERVILPDLRLVDESRFAEGRVLLDDEQTETFSALECVVDFAELNKSPIAHYLNEAVTSRSRLEDAVEGPPLLVNREKFWSVHVVGGQLRLTVLVWLEWLLRQLLFFDHFAYKSVAKANAEV